MEGTTQQARVPDAPRRASVQTRCGTLRAPRRKPGQAGALAVAGGHFPARLAAAAAEREADYRAAASAAEEGVSILPGTLWTPTALTTVLARIQMR